MLEQINELKEQGYKPVVYISDELSNAIGNDDELLRVRRLARTSSIPIYSTKSLPDLNRIRKAYVIRYGYIPQDSEAMIKRKNGKIVSGNL